MSIKSSIKKLIPKKYTLYTTHIYKTLTNGFGRKVYSGNGEDILLYEYLFKDQKKGFYVDVGGYHPIHLSNTYLLHKKGWSGINIDPNPDSIALYNLHRKNDINLKLGVAPEETELTYYRFAEAGINTFSKEHADEKKSKSWSTFLGEEKITCLRLETIFEKYLPKDTTIDLLDVDVEQFDFEVLKSNNWERFRPRVVLVEERNFRTELTENEIYRFLVSKGYEFYSYTEMTLIMHLKGEF